MGRYYRSKKAGKGRGWLRRNLGRAGSALKKRYMPSGKLSLAKVASDAKYALSIAKTARGLLNTEKKRIEINRYEQLLGQINGNGSGHFVWEITPTPSQGTGYGNRVGSSISFRSMFLRISLRQQINNNARARVHFFLVSTPAGTDFNIGQFLQYNKYLYAQNSIAIYDTECQRDPDYFKDYKVLRRKVIKFVPDGISAGSQIVNFSMGLNFGRNGKHIRFDNNGSTVTGMRLHLVALADFGNSSATTQSSLGAVPETATSTGYVLSYDGCQYFIDN